MLVSNSASYLKNQQILKSKNASFSGSSVQQNPLMQTQQADSFKRTAKIMSKSATHSSSGTHLISFGANEGKNAKQVALIGAEFPPYFKVGGVATVMKDYPGVFGTDSGMDSRVFIPYYNGKLEYQDGTKKADGAEVKPDDIGKPTGKVGVLTKDNKPIMTNVDLDQIAVEDLKPEDKGKTWWELEEVSRKNVTLSGKEQEAVLYKIPEKEHYIVYTDATARMPKPYADGSYSSVADVSLKASPYAQFNKAYVELVPALEEKGFNPGHHLCSDSQTAYIPEFMAKKALAGDQYYAGSKSSYVAHNLGKGYQGDSNFSAKDMFYNLADPEHIELVHKDPEYVQHLKDGKETQYFEQFIPSLLDESGKANPTMIPIRHAESGFVPRMDTVAEEYAKSVENNPKTAEGLTGHFKKLAEMGRFGGILNGFGDPSFDPSKPLGLKHYDTQVKDDKTGITHKPFKQFNITDPVKKIMQVKKENTINLLQRLVPGADPTYAIGLDGKKCEITGFIDPKLIEDAKKNKRNLKLFTAVGRGDFQKAHDITLRAFELHAKTEAGKNSVLVLGGEFREGDAEAMLIKNRAKAMVNDPALKGRVVLMDGWLPSKALASASVAGVYPSRFAPCELTDLEAKKYGSTPIVVNSGGLAQKNPDPRIENEKAKATSFKTKDEFYMSHDDLVKADSDLKAKADKSKGALKKESRSFQEEYNKLIEKEKKTRGITIFSEEKRKSDLAAKNVLKSDAYKKLFRECTDEVLSHQVSEGMTARATASPKLEEQMVKNALNAKTDWHNNNELHPTGKASKELYLEKHINAAAAPPEKTMFEGTGEIWDKMKARIEAAKSEATAATKGGKYLAIGGAVSALVGVAGYMIAKRNNKNSATNLANTAMSETSQNNSDDNKLKKNKSFFNA